MSDGEFVEGRGMRPRRTGNQDSQQAAERPGGRYVPVERVPVRVVPDERAQDAPVRHGPARLVPVRPFAPASGRGCLALLVLGVTVATATWLWFRHEVVFPFELRSSVGLQVYAEFYRDLSVAAIVLIGASWLWALRSGGRLGAIKATLIVGAAAVFLAWLWTQVQFQPLARDRQVKELATWTVALVAVALLWRVLKPGGRP